MLLHLLTIIKAQGKIKNKQVLSVAICYEVAVQAEVLAVSHLAWGMNVTLS